MSQIAASLPLGLILATLAASGAHAEIALNPDVTQNTIAKTVCVSGYTATVRPSTRYTNGVKKMLMDKAGITWSAARAFELDHIVPLALGGHPRSLNNLMIQPWEGTNGAKRKDRLEVKLQCLVCTGQVSLRQAQSNIYTDWQAAYRKYASLKCRRER